MNIQIPDEMSTDSKSSLDAEHTLGKVHTKNLIKQTINQIQCASSPGAEAPLDTRNNTVLKGDQGLAGILHASFIDGVAKVIFNPSSGENGGLPNIMLAPLGVASLGTFPLNTMSNKSPSNISLE